MNSVAGLIRGAAAVLFAATLSACSASAPEFPKPEFLASPDQPATDEPKEISDPLETQNRAVFENNQKFNHAVIYPMAKAYNENVPEDVRDRIASFSANLGEPMVFANNVLQLRLQAAAITLGRFAMNSTVGIGGLFDVAATQELNRQSGDLGQTLYVWGVRESPYLVLPVVGPTNMRDAIGTGLEFAAQIPAGQLFPGQMASTVNSVGTVGTFVSPLSSLSKAQDMQMLEESSLDFYAMLRSVVDQKRQAELNEALATSALTAPPKPADPNAIEPVMTLMASPAFSEKRAPAVAAKPAAPEPQTIVTIGVPKLESQAVPQ